MVSWTKAAYIFQSNTGCWHIDQKTNYQLRDIARMPFEYRKGYQSREAALEALNGARAADES